MIVHGQTQRVKRSPQLARTNVMSGPNGPGPGARGASASPAPPPPARSGPKVGTRFRRRPGRAPEAPARGPAPGPGCPAPGASHDRTGLHTPHSIIVFISTYTRIIIIFSIFRARSFDFFPPRVEPEPFHSDSTVTLPFRWRRTQRAQRLRLRKESAAGSQFTEGEYLEFVVEKWGKPKPNAMQEWSFLWANSPESRKGWRPKSNCKTLCIEIR